MTEPPVVLPPHAQPLDHDDPAFLGPYQLYGRLGEGGMGTVFLGRRNGGRWLAIKTMHPHLARHDDFHARFRREVDTARRVESAYTPQVLDADTTSRRPYLVTEFVDGPTLAVEVAERGALSPSELRQLAVNVLSAIVAFHQAGIVHRDVKPSNIILSRTGPRVIDLGIARALDEVGGLTTTGGQQPGTASFMAPEQWNGDRPTAATDVFAWGVVVAQAGTAILPFEGTTLNEIRRSILVEPPRLDGLEPDLRRLVGLALTKQPSDRPSAAELLGLLTGAPQPEAPTRPRATGPLVAGPLVAGPATPAVGSAASGPGPAPSWPSAPGRPPSWPNAGRLAETTVPGSVPPVAVPRAGPGPGAFNSPNPVGGAALDAGGPAAFGVHAGAGGSGTGGLGTGGPGTGGSRTGGLWFVRRPRVLVAAVAAGLALVVGAVVVVVGLLDRGAGTTTPPTADQLSAAALSAVTAADGVRDSDPALARRIDLAAYRLGPTAGSRPDLLRYAEVPTGLEQVDYIVFNAARTFAAAPVDQSGVVRLWQVGSPDEPLELSANISGVSTVAISSDGRSVAATPYDDSAVLLWNTERPTEPVLIRDEVGFYPILMDFTPDGQHLVIVDSDRITVVSIADPAQRTSYPVTPEHSAQFASFSRDGEFLLVIVGSWNEGVDDGVELWRVSDWSRVALLSTGSRSVDDYGPAAGAAVSPDRRHVFTEGPDASLRLWRMDDLSNPVEIPALGAPSAAFSPDGTTLAVGGDPDGAVRLWPVAGPTKPVVVDTGHTQPVLALAYGETGVLATSSTDNTVRVFEPGRFDQPAVLEVAGATYALFGGDGEYLFTVDENLRVRRFDLDRDRVVQRLCDEPFSLITAEEWNRYFPGLDYTPPC